MRARAGVSAGDAGRASASLLPIPETSSREKGDDGTPAPLRTHLWYNIDLDLPPPSSSF